MGGTIVLSEPGSFKGTSGDIVTLDAAVILNGVGKGPIRLPIEAVEALLALAKDERYVDFAKKYGPKANKK
jgi:hypothetical protein